MLLGLAGCKGSGETQSVEATGPLVVERPAAPAAQGDGAEEAVTAGLPTVPLRNPFLRPEELARAAGGTREHLEGLRVAAILYAPPVSRAIVQGRVVAEGDVVGQKRIVQIQPEAIVLNDVADSRREYVVELEAVPGSRMLSPQDR